MQRKAQLCIYKTLDLLNVIAPISEVSSCNYSDHVHCSSPARTLSSLAPKAFVSSTKIVCPQHKTCLLLAINMFACSVIRIWRWVPRTISSLAMNVFICSVKSYSEVSSRDYLIASNKRVRLLFGSWFRNSPKKNRNKRKKVSGKTSFQVRAGPVKRTETR